MNEETEFQANETQGQATPPTSDPWKEVGRQFEALGESLAAAFKAAWRDEEVRRGANEMKTGLESLAKEVGHAIKDTAGSPEVQQARAKTAETFDSLVDAGEQTVQEVRPHLLSALKQVNLELQKFINHLETKKTVSGSQPAEGPEATTGQENAEPDVEAGS